MKAKVHMKFPCGYEYNINFSTGMFDMMGSLDLDDMPSKCPLHGKNCPPRK